MSVIDWDTLKRRLTHAREQARQVTRLGADEARRVLRKRARALSRPRVTPVVTARWLELATVRLGATRLALETSHVRRVVRAPGVTPLPGVSPPLLGITLHDGQLLPIADLAGVLGLDRPSEARHLVIAGTERDELGLLVGEVLGVLRLPIETLPAPPDGARLPHLRGIDAEGLGWLDAEALLSDPRLFHAPTERPETEP